MELRDLIVTPIVIFLVYVAAYLIRPHVTDSVNRKYFFPALTVRIFGALALGFLYQFYYNGGDTFNYHTHGSRHIWNAFMDDPEIGLKLLFADGEVGSNMHKYASKILFFDDPGSYTIVQIAAVFDLITFSSYSGTAVCFAVISFIGAWLLFLAFYHDNKDLHRLIAFAALFIPSVFFWGSALLKDNITLAGVGVATYLVRRMSNENKVGVFPFLILFLALFIVYSIKKYVLLCFVPALFFWIYSIYLSKVKSVILKLLLFPATMVIAVSSGYYAIEQVSKDDPKYALSQLGKTAQITAYDIAYWTGKDAGSTYTLGSLDGTLAGMLKLAPQAINVSLFRPYLWEVKNPLMLMSAIESFLLLIFTIYLIYSSWSYLGKAILNADVVFCFIFSITFAFAVGVSTFNFGTLSRYKIPMLPFFVLGLIMLYNYVNRARKLAELERTE